MGSFRFKTGVLKLKGEAIFWKFWFLMLDFKWFSSKIGIGPNGGGKEGLKNIFRGQVSIETVWNCWKWRRSWIYPFFGLLLFWNRCQTKSRKSLPRKSQTRCKTKRKRNSKIRSWNHVSITCSLKIKGFSNRFLLRSAIIGPPIRR